MKRSGVRGWALVCAAAFAVIAVLSLARVNVLHSSLIFDDLFGPSAHRIVGHARFARGDEFAVETPIALGQARSGRHDRLQVGASQDADVHAYAPGPWWSMAFRPLNLWFLVLPADAAVIARSWSLIAVAMLSLALLSRMLGVRSWLVAGLLAVGGILSPPMQWWFTTTHWLAVSFGVLVPVVLASGGASRRRRVLCGVGAGWVLALGAFTTYPAFFLTTLLASVLAVGFARPDVFRGWPLRVAGVVCGAGVVGGWFWVANRTSLQAVFDTVYPGGRRSSSGEDSPVRMLAGPFLRYVMDDSLRGFSEHAAPLFVFPVAALAVLAPHRAAQRQVQWRRLAGVAIAGALLLTWSLGPLPTSVGALLGLRGVPGQRTVMALVVLCVATGALLLGSLPLGSPPVSAPEELLCTERAACAPKGRAVRCTSVLSGAQSRAVGVGVASAAALGALGEGFLLRRRVGSRALAGREVVLWSLAFAISVGVAALAKRASVRALAPAVLAGAITLGVHPLSVGAGSGDRVARELRRIEQADPSGGRWVADDDIRLNAVVVAAGLSTWSGVHFVPDRSMWAVLDPTSVRESQWNRYAHMVFRLRGDDQSQLAPTIEAVQADAIAVTIGVCRPELDELAVTRVVTLTSLAAPCLSEMTAIRSGPHALRVLKRTSR